MSKRLGRSQNLISVSNSIHKTLKSGTLILSCLTFLCISQSKGQSVTQTYTSATTFTVPVGVTSIRINAWGGGGGTGGQDCGAGCTNASPSQVGYVIATYSVVAGNLINVYPGGKGTNGGSNRGGSGTGAGGAATYSTGVYNGGRGGNAGSIGTSGAGGGGGAATVVAFGSTIRIVAGGGGGGGGMADLANSGRAGSNTPSSSGSTNGGDGTSAGNRDGGGGGGGGGGSNGSSGGTIYTAVGTEVAGNGGSRGNNFESGGTSVNNTTITWTNAGKVEITYTAVGGTASSNQSICSGTQPANISLSNYAGTIQWQVSTDNTTWSNISGATSATLTSTQMGTLTATRYYRALVSDVVNSNTVTVTVSQTPTVSAVASQTYCHNGAASETALSGPVTGTTFAWTNSNTNIGLAASGTGNVPAFTATNSTTAPISATITITPTANSCIGTTSTYTITVNPAPTSANAGSDMSIPLTGKSLSGNNPIVGSGVWSVVSGPSTSVSQFSNPNAHNSTFIPSGGKGNYILRWSISNSSCTVSSDEVLVRVVDQVWTGNNSENWNTDANWGSGTAPTGSAAVDIVVDPGATRNIVLSAPLTLGSLDFNGANVKLVLGNHDLVIGSINNASTNAYVQTNGVGKLVTTIANNSNVLFPIGNSTYNPVTIANNTGSADEFSIRVADEVLTSGTTGTAINNNVVNRTWHIDKTLANAGQGIDITLQWNSNEELGTLSDYKLRHFGNNGWELAAGTSGSVSENGLIKTMIHTGYTGSFSPFAIGSPTGTLPVTWLNFTGKKLAKGVELNWSTATEQNTKDYQVQHSINTQQWNTIGTLPAAGNSNSVRNYQFLHEGPFKSSINHFYRILQRDLDGKSSFSKIIRIEYPMSENDIIIYPNPVHDVLHINIKKRQELRLTNIQGVIVWKSVLLPGRHEIQVSQFASGTYLLQSGKSTYTLIIQ